MLKNKSKLGTKIWLIFIVYGLIGQLAWTIENMYLNLYIYRTVTYDPNAIAWMVALSGIVATVTTLLMGALSDRLGKRKVFISVGYILWGVSIVLFSFITKDNVQKLFPSGNTILITVALIIALDCVMTFFGSTANDAAFNVWVTDVTNEHNRGKAEGILSAMPLLGMLVVFGIFDGFTQKGKWLEFYLIIGSIVFIAGILGLFFITDVEKKQETTSKTNYFKNLLHGFKSSTIKSNRDLYIVFIAMAIVGISQQIFMPYFIIYFQYYLKIADYALILGGILILSSIISVIGGQIIDKKGKKSLLALSGIMYIVGLFLIFVLGLILKDNKALIIASSILVGTLMMGSYLLIMVALNALTRDLVPKNSIGLFNGIRMIFYVTIPMIIGPFIGSAIIKGSKNTYVDEFGQTQYIPNPYIFLGATIAGLLLLIPIYRILKNKKVVQLEGNSNENNL